MSYVLTYTKEAEKNFVSIFDYIAQDNPSKAIEYTENLKTRIDRLIESPRIGKIKDGSDTERIFVVDKYKVHYRIIEKKKVVLIRYIKHERQR